MGSKPDLRGLDPTPLTLSEVHRLLYRNAPATVAKNGMKTNVSPMFLTYFMMKWEDVEQHESSQRCTVCGKALMRTEVVKDEKGVSYEGFVCHADKQVTWVRLA
jgi:hypothetical protein